MSPPKIHIAKPEHEVAYQDLCALVSKHAASVSSVELLAIAANMLGKLVALQDQRKMTPAQAMEIVAANIEGGNREAQQKLLGMKGGTA